MKTVLSITQAANYVGVRERILADLVAAGKIYHRKIGRDVVFIQEELDAWLDEQPGLVRENQRRSDISSDDASDTNRANASPSETSVHPIPLHQRAPRLSFREKYRQ